MPTGEHEFEAQHGLPEPLPRGETLRWQGAPDGWSLAREVFHLRAIGLYFALLLSWQLVTQLYDGMPLAAALLSVGKVMPLALAALALLAVLAWLTARTTVYTFTDRRVVMRVGIVLTVTYNIPFSRIAAATLRAGRHGHGDIALELMPGDQIAYLHLWPHARPWHLRRTQPMLRQVPQAAAAAKLLSQLLQQSAQQAGPGWQPAAAPADAPLPVTLQHAPSA
jgi:hypothetical protein